MSLNNLYIKENLEWKVENYIDQKYLWKM